MSVESDSLLEVIQTTSAEPQKVAGDAGSYENPTLSEMIAAHKYLSGTDTNVMSNPIRAMRFVKLRPPGAV